MLNFLNKLFCLIWFISLISCNPVDVYDESVIVNNALNNDEDEPLITQDITVSYVSSIDNGLDNNTLRLLVNLSPNIDLNAIIDLGLVYSEEQNPNLSDNKVSATNIQESNTIDVEQLIEGQTYYFRAYMITKQGVFYSSGIITATVPETDCEIFPENDNINEWYYLIDPEQDVYNTSDIYIITVLSPLNFNFSNQYEVYLYSNEVEIQFIANGSNFESFYNDNDQLTYNYNFTIPENLTPSSCYTIRIIPAAWSNEEDIAISNSFMILQ